ncbi:MAG: tRNA (adenosine(37)-N6)-threonylcarbamoyltransferase complex dimerization subunit type 1 TsaB [Saprospiraceae bacterium]
MPYILSIETSTQICSVALSQAEKVISLQEIEQKNAHAAHITLLIERCMEEAALSLSALDAVAVSMGPGSYTGLRIGLSTAKGICYALDKPLIAVDTLQSLGKALADVDGNREDTLYCPMIDARRMEVYTTFYDSKAKEVSQKEALVLEDGIFGKLFEDKVSRLVFGGDGAHKTSSISIDGKTLLSDIQCSARHIAPLAYESYRMKRFQDVAYSSPFYLKSPNITKSKKKLL